MMMMSVVRLRHRFAIAALALVAAAVAVPATTASAATRYGELTATWWTWVYSQPAVDVGGTNTFPILDKTGAYAAVGQENGIGPGNKYFFLTGTFGFVLPGGPVTRTVTVPKGKALFFPIINIEVDNAVDVPPPTPFTVPQLKAQAKANIDSVTSTSATLDGQPVEIFRSTSPTFDYTVPDENSIYDYFGSVGPQFEGRIKPAIADGYWAYVPPLTPGHHVLKFASTNSSGFQLDVTYNLTIP
jgi:hypothetical protein